MNSMEQNRKIVQDGLDKRASKRNKAIIEAEQEVITVQIFKIVNTNANNAECKQQPVYIETPVCKANKKPNKRIAMFRNMSAVNFVVSTVALIISIVLYATHLTDLICMIATSILPVFMIILNLCIFVKMQKKLKRRV